MIHYINSSVTFLFLLNIKNFKSIHIGKDRYILFFLTAMNDYIHFSIYPLMGKETVLDLHYQKFYFSDYLL